MSMPPLYRKLQTNRRMYPHPAQGIIYSRRSNLHPTPNLSLRRRQVLSVRHYDLVSNSNDVVNPSPMSRIPRIVFTCDGVNLLSNLNLGVTVGGFYVGRAPLISCARLPSTIVSTCGSGQPVFADVTWHRQADLPKGRRCLRLPPSRICHAWRPERSV